jgi:hypothetical protein
LAPNSTAKTRRDYFFTTPDLFSAITDFDVIDDGAFSVHSQVTITLTIRPTPYYALKFDTVPFIKVPPATLGISYKQMALGLPRPPARCYPKHQGQIPETCRRLRLHSHMGLRFQQLRIWLPYRI